MGKSPIVKNCVNNYLILNKVFRPLMCCILVSCADFEAILWYCMLHTSILPPHGIATLSNQCIMSQEQPVLFHLI